MIKATIVGLSRRISLLMSKSTQKHYCHIYYTESSSRERENKPENISYLKPTSVGRDLQNRKTRRLHEFGSIGNKNFEKIELLPAMITLDWEIPLYRGIDQIYEVLPYVFNATTQGKLSFTMKVKLGNEILPVDIVTKSEDADSIQFPELEGDVLEDSTPKISLSLQVNNTFSILGAEELPAFSFNDEDEFICIKGEGMV